MMYIFFLRVLSTMMIILNIGGEGAWQSLCFFYIFSINNEHIIYFSKYIQTFDRKIGIELSKL